MKWFEKELEWRQCWNCKNIAEMENIADGWRCPECRGRHTSLSLPKTPDGALLVDYGLTPLEEEINEIYRKSCIYATLTTIGIMVGFPLLFHLEYFFDVIIRWLK